MENFSFQRAPEEHQDRMAPSINRTAGSLRQAAAVDDIHNLMHNPPSTTLIPPPPLPTPSPPQLGPFPP